MEIKKLSTQYYATLKANPVGVLLQTYGALCLIDLIFNGKFGITEYSVKLVTTRITQIVVNFK